MEEPAKWQLAGGYPLPDAAHPAAEEYTIALYHQLHCLVGGPLERADEQR